MGTQLKKSSGGRGIEWTDETRNPMGGCKHGCKWVMPDGKIAECYAGSIAEGGFAKSHYPHGFEHHYWRPHIANALHLGPEPSLIFVDSMSDLFEAGRPRDHVREVFRGMDRGSHHAYQCLTKAAPQVRHYINDFPPNLWVGVSSPPDWMRGKRLTRPMQESMLRTSMRALRDVRKQSGNLTWLSAEPISWDIASALGEDHPLDWVVIGAASNGRQNHQPDAEHVRNLLDLMDATRTPVFFKGNLKPLFVDGPFCDQRLDRWREDFPLCYRDGSDIPAVERRQALCLEHGWARSLPHVRREEKVPGVRSRAAVKANISRGALGRSLAGVRAAATRGGWSRDRLEERERQVRERAARRGVAPGEQS